MGGHDVDPTENRVPIVFFSSKTDEVSSIIILNDTSTT